jgi:hypothetical protein
MLCLPVDLLFHFSHAHVSKCREDSVSEGSDGPDCCYCYGIGQRTPPSRRCFKSSSSHGFGSGCGLGFGSVAGTGFGGGGNGGLFGMIAPMESLDQMHSAAILRLTGYSAEHYFQLSP